MKKLFYLVVLTVFLTSCHGSGWVKTDDDAYLYITEEMDKSDNLYDEDYTYSWTGDTNGRLIWGKGYLTIEDDDKTVFSKRITAYFGLWGNAITDELLDGEEQLFLDDNNMGLLVSDNIVLFGKFKDGEPRHDVDCFSNGNLVYHGDMLDYDFHGHGTYYDEDGTMLYDGGWKNGKMNGVAVSRNPDGSYNKVVYENDEIADSFFAQYQYYESLYDEIGQTEFESLVNEYYLYDYYGIYFYLGFTLFYALLGFLVYRVYAKTIEKGSNNRIGRIEPLSVAELRTYSIWGGLIGLDHAKASSLTFLVPLTISFAFFMSTLKNFMLYIGHPAVWFIAPQYSVWQILLFVLWVAFFVLDYFWVGYLVYKYNFVYFRHDKYESDILNNTITRIQGFMEQLPTERKEIMNITKKALAKMKKINAEKQEKKSMVGAFFDILTSDSVGFAQQKYLSIEEQFNIVQEQQYNLFVLNETLKQYLEEMRKAAIRNLFLAKELLSLKKTISKQEAQRLQVDNLEFDFSDIDLALDIDSLETLFDENEKNNQYMFNTFNAALYRYGRQGKMTWGNAFNFATGMAEGLANRAANQQAQIERYAEGCAKTIKNVDMIIKDMEGQEVTIMRALELLSALYAAERAFLQAYADLRDDVFGKECTYTTYQNAIKNGYTIQSPQEFKEKLHHLCAVCSEYNKINKIQLDNN